MEEVPMTSARRRRKCKNCCELFFPDRRNLKKQRYCGKPGCRKASKAAAQARWLAQEENKTYFRSPENVRRVQEWRAQHPGYWRNGSRRKNALQDHSPEKRTEKQYVKTELTKETLQDHIIAQHSVLIGLIAHLTGKTLQDDIADTTRHMQQLGSDILRSSTLTLQGGNYVDKKPYTPGPDP
jgi:hypothetical protein